MKRFTESAIERLRPRATKYLENEPGGLYMAIHPTGLKVWSSYYRAQDGKRRWKKLGVYPATDIDKARSLNSDVQDLARDGMDPKHIEDGVGREPNLEEVFNLFINKGVDKTGNPLRGSTIEGYRQAFNADILPFLGQRKANDLRKRDLIPVLEKIKTRGSTNQANQVYRRLRRVLSFAAARDIIEFNPMTDMEPIGTTNRRDRHLSDKEIKCFYDHLPDCIMGDDISRILLLILVTGVRPGEAAGINKDEIDGNWWTIPAERRKKPKPHRVFLTPMARDLLPDDRFSISNPRAVSKALLRSIEGYQLKKGWRPPTLPIEKFIPNDLRRTMATGLAALGFSDEVITAAQGREKIGVIGTYNLYRYDKERKKAATAWAKKLTSLI